MCWWSCDKCIGFDWIGVYEYNHFRSVQLFTVLMAHIWVCVSWDESWNCWDTKCPLQKLQPPTIPQHNQLNKWVYFESWCKIITSFLRINAVFFSFCHHRCFQFWETDLYLQGLPNYNPSLICTSCDFRHRIWDFRLISAKMYNLIKQKSQFCNQKSILFITVWSADLCFAYCEFGCDGQVDD